MSDDDLVRRGLEQSRTLFPDAVAGTEVRIGCCRWREVLSQATGKRVDLIYLGAAAPAEAEAVPAGGEQQTTLFD